MVGNHDEDHWHWNDYGCSRHDYRNAGTIRYLFETNKEFFQAAYSIENRIFKINDEKIILDGKMQEYILTNRKDFEKTI